MTQRDLFQRLSAGSVSGRFDLFVKLGALLLAIGAALFVVALSGDGEVRAWQAFHVNWLFFTTITTAAVMFVAMSASPTSNHHDR